MPIYMDIHVIPGVKAQDVAEAHRKDLFHAEEYGCKCMTYWIDEERENVFCLIEAPDKETVNAMHNRAHGLIANKIIEVDSSVVESFLGRIYDPENATITSDGLKVFSESSFRVLLIVWISDPILLKYRYGNEKAIELLTQTNNLVRKNASVYKGREVEHDKPGFIISFDSAAQAIACALEIQHNLDAEFLDKTLFRMSLHAGEPVDTSELLFGDALRFADFLCGISPAGQLSITPEVRDLVANQQFDLIKGVMILSPRDKQFLELLFSTLDKKWQDADLNLDDYCRAMAMSKSQLYRKTIELSGMSPNVLLREFRLHKAKELLKKQLSSIAQITFDCGFTSPSYFTKCFKKKYGLLPMAYIDLLQ